MCQGGNKALSVYVAPETSEDNDAEPGEADASKKVRLPGMMRFIFLSYGLHMAFIWVSVWSCESEVVKGAAELGPVPWPYRGRYLTRVLWPVMPAEQFGLIHL